MEYGSSPPKILEYQARARRRRTLRKAITVLAIAASIIGYFRLTSYYLSFKHKRAKYHADFAKACDSLLINYPLGTNKYVEISAKDSSLPKMISDLHRRESGWHATRFGFWCTEAMLTVLLLFGSRSGTRWTRIRRIPGL